MDIAWKTARINVSTALEGVKENQKIWNTNLYNNSKILKTREGGALRNSRQDKVAKNGNACECYWESIETLLLVEISQ